MLRKGDLVLVADSEIIPSDGEIAEGVALVDESAITGESAPVVREAGGSLCGVTGGTRVLSGKIKIRITADPGETFLDQMIGMVESAKRQKTPNEQALEILLIGLTGLFLVVVVSLEAFARLHGHGSIGARSRRSSGLSDAHDHWRPSACHRHCWNGSAAPAQRHRSERQGG